MGAPVKGPAGRRTSCRWLDSLTYPIATRSRLCTVRLLQRGAYLPYTVDLWLAVGHGADVAGRVP